MRLVAPDPLSGRYAMQGKQMEAGLKLWAHRSGGSLSLEEFPSPLANNIPPPLGEARVGAQGGGSDIVLGPYGSDSVRAIATAFPARIVWNHGAAANDVQRLPNVISIPSPSSQYLVALARAVARLRPGGKIAVVTAEGRFAEYAWKGLLAAADSVDLQLAGHYSFHSPSLLAGPAGPREPRFGAMRAFEASLEGRGAGYDAVLTVGPVQQEVALFQRLLDDTPVPLLGGVSPGLAAFPDALAANPEGFLAPVQWHPSVAASPQLGPTSSEILDDARSLGLEPIDYVAAQAYAAALIADYCYRRDPIHPEKVARNLHTSTFFGDFELDTVTGEQIGHQMNVVQWRNGRQEPIDAR